MGKLINLGLVFGLIASGCSDYKVNTKENSVNARISLTDNKSENLEEKLFKDAEDRKLDMDFTRALLIASGCENFMIDYYKEKLDSFVSEIVDAVPSSDNGMNKAKLIAKSIKERTEYKLFEYRIHHLANKEIRQGNCLGLTILFNLACEKAGIKSGFMNNLTHSFPYVEIEGKRSYLDLTTENLAPDKSDLEDEFKFEPSKLDVVAQIYCIKGAGLSRDGKIEEANEVYKKGLKVYPNLQILENLVKMTEYLNDEEACRNMNLYIKAYPELPQLYNYKAGILLRLKRNDEAVSCLKKSLEIKKDEEVKKWIDEIEKK